MASELRNLWGQVLQGCADILRGFDDDESSHRSPRGGISWPDQYKSSLLRLVDRGMVAGLLGWARIPGENDPSVGSISSILIDRFHDQAHEANETRAAALELYEAVAHDVALPIVYRKGSILADYYPAIGCRHHGDIDIFLPENAIRDVVALLRRLGYAPLVMERAERLFLSLGTNAPVAMVRDETVVDIATSLVMPRYETEESRALFQEMIDTATGSWGLPSGTPPFLLLDLVLNLEQTHTTLRYVASGRFQRVISYLDLVAVVARMTEREWQLFDESVERIGAATAVSFAFGNCLRLCSGFAGATEMRGRVRGNERILDEVGRWEMDRPYCWEVGLLDRLLLEELPADLQTLCSRYDFSSKERRT